MQVQVQVHDGNSVLPAPPLPFPSLDSFFAVFFPVALSLSLPATYGPVRLRYHIQDNKSALSLSLSQSLLWPLGSSVALSLWSLAFSHSP